jgi:DNA polymerase III subunit gamma/tau
MTTRPWGSWPAPPTAACATALSLLDQAIAFGGGRVTEAEVRAMLGSLSGDQSFELIAALADGDAARLLAEVERLGSLTPDFGELLKELIGVLHRVALFQQVPGLIPADDADRERIAGLAGRMAPEDVQLYYQVALTGQQDLPLAPDPRMGFEMVLLRALAFRPADPGRPGIATAAAGVQSPERPSEPGIKAPPGTPTRAGDQTPAPVGAVEAAAHPRPGDASQGCADGPLRPASGTDSIPRGLASAADWHRLVERLQVGGVASQLARNCTLIAWTDGHLTLALDPAAEQLRSRGTEQRLREALERALGGSVQLEIQVARPQQETPAQRRIREGEERQRKAQEAMDHDPVVLGLREQLDAEWVPGSVQPTD